MTELTLELPPEVYRRLKKEAARLGKPPQLLAEEWLAERLARPITRYETDREKARQALREAGLLTQIGPHLREIADPTVHLEEINAALERAGGKKLSEIILEQRGPKG